MKISWAPTARKTYFIVLDYLEQTWTKREALNFVDEVEKVLNHLKENPDMFEAFGKKKNMFCPVSFGWILLLPFKSYPFSLFIFKFFLLGIFKCFKYSKITIIWLSCSASLF